MEIENLSNIEKVMNGTQRKEVYFPFLMNKERSVTIDCETLLQGDYLSLYKKKVAYGEEPETVLLYLRNLKNRRQPSKEVRLTHDNVKSYQGYNIRFTTRKQTIVRKILGISDSGKSIKIDYQNLGNCLNLTRKIYVIV